MTVKLIPQKILERVEAKKLPFFRKFSDISAQNFQVSKGKGFKPRPINRTYIGEHFKPIENMAELIPFSGHVPRESPFPKKSAIS